MNKEEKAIADSIAQILLEAMNKLSEAVTLNAAATRYLADTIGYNVDKFSDGKVKLTSTESPDSPHEEPPAKVTFEELRAAVNRFAADEGKEKTIELVKVYAPSGALKDVAESDYSDLLSSVL